MKEKLIQEISTAMAEVLSFEQVAHLNSVLLQVVSQYTITEDGETLHENAVSNDRLLDIFLSAKTSGGLHHSDYQILWLYHSAVVQKDA